VRFDAWGGSGNDRLVVEVKVLYVVHLAGLEMTKFLLHLLQGVVLETMSSHSMITGA
jgi:hypothetical protein